MAEDTKNPEVENTEVTEVAPAATEEVAPAATEEVTPAVAEEVAPAVAEEVTPAVAEEVAPAATEEVAPAVAEETASTPDDATPKTINDIKRKQKLEATVKRIEIYGAFLDVGVGTDAIIHVSQLGSGKRVADILKKGQKVTVYVDKLNIEKNQIIVTMVEPLAVEWGDLKAGNVYAGKITRLEKFGAFVSIGAEKEGLVHISELSHDYVQDPSAVVKVGDEVEVQVLDYSKRKRRINLSMKALMEKPESSQPEAAAATNPFDFKYEEEVEEEVPTAMEFAFRKANGSQSGGGAGEDRRSRRRKSSKSQRRRDRRNQRNDIISRTLEMTQDDE